MQYYISEIILTVFTCMLVYICQCSNAYHVGYCFDHWTFLSFCILPVGQNIYEHASVATPKSSLWGAMGANKRNFQARLRSPCSLPTLSLFPARLDLVDNIVLLNEVAKFKVP
jgi:hypothetical protein